MSGSGMNRRQFLQSGGLAAAGMAVIASGTTIMASDGAWALELGTLNAHEGMTLLRMARRIYPHDTLADMYYAGVVQGLDSGAAGDPGTAQLLKEGIGELDQAKGIAFVELSDGNQLEVLTAMQDGAFFQQVRGSCITGLYNNPLVWRHFGYEGPSFPYGGYRERGFNDLNWLGDPPEDASPKDA